MFSRSSQEPLTAEPRKEIHTMKKSAAFAVIFAAAFLTISSTNRVAQAQGTLPQRMGTNSYAAKFICGVQPQVGGYSPFALPDAQAGRYSTKINVHNNTGSSITFRKKIIQLRGGEVATAPQWKSPAESLKEDEALEVVCKDIYGYLNIPQPPSGDPWRYIEGFVIFEVYCVSNPPSDGCETPPDPLDVVGIYTYKGDLPGTTNANASGVSIDVVVYPAKTNRHILH
jgi:hypothetical protein